MIATAIVRVWDAVVRSLHWLLAVSLISAWVSGHLEFRWFDEVHHTSGYIVGGVVLVRLVWGFVGKGHARFSKFVRSPRATLAYARQLLAAREPRHLGHNPLGAWMAVALLIVAVALSLTGALYITDQFWGYAWLSDTHAVLAWIALALVLAHWMGVAFTSWCHRENLVTAMFSGDKRARENGDVD